MEQVRVDVEAGARTYPVLIGQRLLPRIGELLDGLGVGPNRLIVSSPAIWRHHGATVSETFEGVTPIILPDGERFKNLQTVSRLYDALIRAGADRASTVVVLGGGVLGDLAGFAAATYLRGIGLVQIPTTLLAQVDSSVGGKVGVNHALGKNLIGAFYPPAAVVADTGALGTLPRREFRAGLYEVVKYGVIASRDLFDRVGRDLSAIFSRDAAVLIPVIADCCRIKSRIVGADEREAGPRRVLNFGHTVGHALEAITKYRRFRHGEAIGYGMLAAAELSAARGLLPASDREALHQLIVQMGPLPQVADLSIRDALQAIGRDKKVVAGRLHFVLAASIGTTEVASDVSEEELTAAMRKIGMAP
jgi:3-dehydroquinate synthase